MAAIPSERDVACPRCKKEIPPDAPDGICPRCLFESTRTRVPDRIGVFAIESRIGRGGMGTVYRARQSTPDRAVALKIIHAELPDDAERRFRNEIDAVAKLDHAHILPIYEVGEHEGRLFYTMKLIDGGTLAEKAESFRDPRHAARIVTTIARAVQHAHERGVLHRDLKPSNVLLDEVFNPYVTDFGVARLAGRTGATLSGSIVGTPEYMSPEQARGDERAIGPASDIWSLGAILYELVTGRPPFTGTTVPEILARVANEDPPPLPPKIDRDLATICLTCLAKEPERRYASVADLIDDLRRVLDGEPIAARASSRVTRAWRWSRRHPLVASTLAGIMLLLAVVSGAAISVARDQRDELRASALDTNAALARAQAGAFLLELRDHADRVRAGARDPSVIALAERGPTRPIPPNDVLKAHAGGVFSSVSTFATDGAPITRWPMPSDPPPGKEVYWDQNFAFRDYFAGAAKIAASRDDGVYVARSYVSYTKQLSPTAEDGYRFSLSAPIRGKDGRWRGVFLASVAADAAFGRTPMSDPSRSRTIALVGLHDRESKREKTLPKGVWVLFHPRLERGREVGVDDSIAEEVEAMLVAVATSNESFAPVSVTPIVDEDYRDPVIGTDARFLAAFYPAGGTGYGVLVQTPWEEAVASNTSFARRLLTRAGIPLAIGILAIAVILVLLTHRRPA